MKLLARILAMSFVAASGAWAMTPIMSVGPSGPHNTIDSNRDACWSEPPDLDGLIATSEIIGQFGLESEVANDFHLANDEIITLARWWGGYYNNNGCDDRSIPSTWNLEFFDDDGCVPNNLLAEYVIPDYAGETYVYCQGGFYPIFVYEGAVSFPVAAAVRYWFVAQAGDHPFPPQVGRVAAGSVTDCDSMFRCAFFSYPDWSHGDGLPPIWYDASQEFECGVVPTKNTSWGAVKAIYR
jgi:hypothetical protein